MALYNKYNRTQSLEVIDSLIDRTVERINTLQETEKQLRSLRVFVCDPPRDEPQLDDVWMVESRSGGTPHYVGVKGAKANPDFVCTCKAGVKGVHCWALNGVMDYYASHNRIDVKTFTFYDNTFALRTAWKLAN